MDANSLLSSMTDELKENVYVEFALYDVPELKTGSIYLKDWLTEKHQEILQAEVVNFDIKTEKNYGYLMFTIFICM